jgi:hypothetical protein
MAAHEHPSGAFSFRTPAAWQVGALAGRKDVWEAQGDEGIVWFIYRAGSNGFDSQHVNCMGERLAGTLATSTIMGYEYDFHEGNFAGRTALDSAFVVSYASPARGQSAWHQRNVTIIGNTDLLCVVAFSPAAAWKSSKQVRRTMDAVVGSLTFPAPK